MAAACLAAAAVALAAPTGAQAYPCGDGRPAVVEGRELSSVPIDECRMPENVRPRRSVRRERKTGDMSGLTVFVLAIAGALLIPIGRKGLPLSSDPFVHDPGHDRPF